MRMKADNILIEPELYPQRKIGSIVLPDTLESKKKFARGKVMAIGPGLWLHNGDRPPIEVAVGEHVLYYYASAIDIVVQDKNMHIVVEREVIATLELNDLAD